MSHDMDDIKTDLSSAHAKITSGDDTISDNDELSDSPPFKWFFGILSGYIVAMMTFIGIWRGLEIYLNPSRDEAWGIFFWDKHFLWRQLASILGTAAGASIAALAVRKRGEIAVALVGLPGSLGWAVVAYLSFTHQTGSNSLQSFFIEHNNPSLSEYLGNRLIAVALAVGSVILGYRVGQVCTPISRAIARHFDSRKGSIFGVRWYHILWLPLVAYLCVVIAAYGGAYVIHFVLASWTNEGLGIFSILITFLMIGWGWTVNLCYTGIQRAYLLLSGLDEETIAPTPISILKFGCGFPLLAVLSQLVLIFLQNCLSKLFK